MCKMSNSAANIAEKATAKVVSPVKEAKDTAKNVRFSLCLN